MQVIGSGFGRTGTLSMKAALEQLGFGPCYHMEEVFRRPAHVRAWGAARPGQPPDFDLVFDGFESAVDFPASLYYRELLERFPDAKVVHTVRDPDRWYDSTNATIYPARTMFPAPIRRGVPLVRDLVGMLDAVIWDGLFDGRFEDRAHAIGVFEQWTEDVVAHVPADQLLVFEPAQGWEPLCGFLDVPVPATPFPRVNDSAAFTRRTNVVRYGSRALLGGIGAAGVLGLRRVARR